MNKRRGVVVRLLVVVDMAIPTGISAPSAIPRPVFLVLFSAASTSLTGGGFGWRGDQLPCSHPHGRSGGGQRASLRARPPRPNHLPPTAPHHPGPTSQPACLPANLAPGVAWCRMFPAFPQRAP
ncbi:hypothetical protein QBC39DRAFT_73070 [Podospora conica]|nr:hypothetical protein QBC39DRAFT_73070 [Schizothecium conicum]